MNPDQALEVILSGQQRISDLINEGPHDDSRVKFRIIENDLDEFIIANFHKGTPEYDKLHAALHPMGFGGGGNPWRSLVSDARFLMDALTLVEHRLRAGQAKFKAVESPEEHLIEAGQPHAGYVVLRDIVETTKSDILLVDNWVDRTLFELLSNLKGPARIRFLTQQNYLPGDFISEAKKFGKQHTRQVQVRVIAEIHDRFLVIDGRLYHSGASFKDWGKKTSVVSEMKDIAATTINHLEAQWSGATALL